MRRVVRPLAVFGVASLASLVAGVQLVILGVGGAHGSDGATTASSAAFGPYEHDLGRLKLVEKTLYYVEESYVDPNRVDWEAMYVAALEAVERRVPSTVFTRQPGGSMVSVQIGEYPTVLEVAPIADRRRLVEELKVVAGLLDQHLSPDEIPSDMPGIDPFADVEYTMINGMLSTLDPHSVLLPPPDATEMDVENQGDFGGLGIVIVERDNRLTIEYAIPNTPAMKAGLRADDRIVRIDGESTINMSLDEAVRLLRGPIGAPVNLEILREDERESVAHAITREVIPLHEVKGELLAGDVGYIQIESFHEKVEKQLLAELAQLHRESATGQLRGLVLDLRDNPGGFLNQAVRVADAFLDNGTIVSTVDATGQKRDEEVATVGNEPMYPMVVLVDASSASASEIVAGALRNNNRAVIVGDRTFGKGSVQNLHNLVDDSKLKITISKYLTPGERSIQSVGVPADIALRSELIEPGPEGPNRLAESKISLFSRERVRREADLDKHLDRESFTVEDPVYVISYLKPEQEPRAARLPVPEEDVQVRLARDVLLAAPSWRRAEVLAAAGPVVQRAETQGARDIEAAFAQVGIDWTDGAAAPRGVASPPVTLKLDLGSDGVLTAGEMETVALEVTNTSDRALYRVAVVAGENEVLAGKEFFFGKLAPGERRRWEHRVTPTDGYPSEHMPVTFEVHDSGEGVLASEQLPVVVAGRPLPRLEWSWTVADGGDQDGLAEVGEEVEIALTVQNVGNGPTSDAFARIKNKSRRALDIVSGNASPGVMVDEAGAPCVPEQPGVEAGAVFGDPAHERVLAGKEPLWPEACHPVLEPGASWTGRFVVALKEEPADGAYGLELVIGDEDAYDYASVMRSEFYSYWTQQDDISFSVGAALPEGPARRPPAVKITRSPGLITDTVRATVSGVVEDDSGIAHVMVWAGEDKVFYQGSGASSTVRSVPFTADVALEPGSNTITVLATDVDGFTHSASVVTFHGSKEVARATP